jgi:hypothetical protein
MGGVRRGESAVEEEVDKNAESPGCAFRTLQKRLLTFLNSRINDSFRPDRSPESDEVPEVETARNRLLQNSLAPQLLFAVRLDKMLQVELRSRRLQVRALSGILS